jgi:hypothetical protein
MQKLSHLWETEKELTDRPYARLRGESLAHAAALIVLIERAKEKDPDFVLAARELFDEFLGKQLVTSGGSKEELIKEATIAARSYFVNLMDANLPAPKEGVQESRLTFRRRFLNWLQRG